MAHVIIPDYPIKVQYTIGGTASGGPFAFSFTYFAAEDIDVYVGTTLLSYPSQYTVDGVPGSDGGYQGGQVNLFAAVADVTLTIYRNIAIERVSDFPVAGSFNRQTLNNTLDKHVAMIQQVDERVDRTFGWPVTTPPGSAPHLGTMAFQDADGVAITGGNVDHVFMVDPLITNGQWTNATLFNAHIGGVDINGGSLDSVSIYNSNLFGATITNPAIIGGGYWNNPTLNSPSVVNGTFASPTIIAGSIIDGTIINSPTINNASINNPAVGGGGFNGPTINDPHVVNGDFASPSIIGGLIGEGTIINDAILNNATLNNPALNGGYWSTVTLNNATINAPIINNPAIAGGYWTTVTLNSATINAPVINNPAIAAGSYTEPTLINPHSTGGDFSEPSIEAGDISGGTTIDSPVVTNATITTSTFTGGIITNPAISNAGITGGTITDLPVPVNPGDVATKQYVDAIAMGGVVPGGFGHSFRNVLRNGGFEVWQRTSGGVPSTGFAIPPSTGRYTADGWYGLTGANQTMNVLQTTPLTIAGVQNGSAWSAYVGRSAGSTGVGLMTFEHALDTDEIVRIRGRIVTLSALLYAGTNWSPVNGLLNIYLLTGTGPVGRASSGFTGQVLAADASRNVVPGAAVTQTFGTSGAIVPANATQASIYLQWTPVGTAGANDHFQIDNVQLELGSTYTVFEHRPFQTDLELNKRHFQKSQNYGVAPSSGTGNNNGVASVTQVLAGVTTEYGWSVKLAPSMRNTPTVTLYNPVSANAQARNLHKSADCANTTAWLMGSEALTFYYQSAVASVAGESNVVHWAADAGI